MDRRRQESRFLRWDFPTLCGCFFLSGAAGLVYETVWTQQFAVVFGTTELALATVLAAYMAGLAAGAAVAGRLLRRQRRLLHLYALLELGIAACALAVPWAIEVAGALHAAVLGSDGLPSADGSTVALALYVATSFSILVLPTAMMGATLPVLIHHVVRRDDQVGRRVGTLYTVNTVGAALGTLLAAFLLLPHLGLAATVRVGAGLTGLAAAVAALLARSSPVAEPLAEGELDASSSELGKPPPGDRLDRSLLPLILVSGGVSFTLEVLWTRLLTLVLGGSMYAIATMLASFLLGIALGAALAGRLAGERRQARLGFVVAQVAAAASTVLAFLLADRLLGLSRLLQANWAPVEVAAGLSSAFLCSLTLLPGAIAFGATFPFAVRAVAANAEGAGIAAGRVFACNTAGAIAGSLAAGFVVLPSLGFAGTVRAAAITCLVLAAVAAPQRQDDRPLRSWRRLLASSAGILAVVALLIAPVPADPEALLRHAVLSGTRDATSAPALVESFEGSIAHFGVGRSATVLVFDQRNQWQLVSNGLPESSIGPPWGRPKLATARWLSLLPQAARPDARSMLVIGLGGGVSLEDVPRSFEEIHVLELEAEVIRANERLRELRRKDPLADPRLELHLGDARGALARTRREFDAIVSQPSHPWTAGASHLFTQEFFALVRDRLAPSGVFVQWMGLPFVDRELLQSLIATLCDVFPEVEIYEPELGAVLLLASREPLDVDRTAVLALEIDPEAWSRVGVSVPEEVTASRLVDAVGAQRVAHGGTVSTDGLNVLRVGAPRVLRHGWGNRASVARMFESVDSMRTGLAVAAPQRRLLLYRALLATGDLERGRYLLGSLDSRAERQTAQGLWLLASGAPGRASVALSRLLKLDNRWPEARAGLLRAQRPDLEAGRTPVALSTLLSPLTASESLVVSGWSAAYSGQWQAVADRDGELSVLGLRHPLHDEAVRLRAQWRIHLGSADEALALLEPLLAPSPAAADLLLLAAAGNAAARPRVALAAIEEALPGLASPSLRAEARSLLLAIKSGELDSDAEAWGRQLFAGI